MKRGYISMAVASILFGATISMANAQISNTKTVAQLGKTSVANATKSANKKAGKLVQEAIDSLKQTHNALLALDKNKKDEAISDIEKALGKLEVVLSAKDAPKFLPIKSYVNVNEFVGTSDSIKATIKLAKQLLDDGKVQQARGILIPLSSEVDITTLSLPMVSYPNALKLASSYIHSNKIAEAKDVLALALNTFDETTIIVPIPLMKASDLINAASNLAKKDKDLALKYLDAASKNLKVAQNLGYVSKSQFTYKEMQQKISDIEKEIKGKNKAEKLFESLENKIKDFKDKVFSPKK